MHKILFLDFHQKKKVIYQNGSQIYKKHMEMSSRHLVHFLKIQILNTRFLVLKLQNSSVNHLRLLAILAVVKKLAVNLEVELRNHRVQNVVILLE